MNFRCCGYHHYGEYLDYIKLLVAAVTQTAQRPLDHRTNGRWPPPYALLAEHNWTEYRLSKECGLSDSTLANIFRRNTMPSTSTLEAICDGFGITLSQFFCESEMVELSPELKELFDNWVNLTADQKQAALQIMRAFNSEKK